MESALALCGSATSVQGATAVTATTLPGTGVNGLLEDFKVLPSLSFPLLLLPLAWATELRRPRDPDGVCTMADAAFDDECRRNVGAGCGDGYSCCCGDGGGSPLLAPRSPRSRRSWQVRLRRGSGRIGCAAGVVESTGGSVPAEAGPLDSVRMAIPGGSDPDVMDCWRRDGPRWAGVGEAAGDVCVPWGAAAPVIAASTASLLGNSRLLGGECCCERKGEGCSG
jgi:hypothetical protein